MSLLHDQHYVISHLRATYLETCPDDVGERVIRPSHLYITKGGPRKLNWAASTLLSKARPESPPIPTNTMTRVMPPIRRNFNDDDEEEELTQLRAGVKSFRRRPRASTLPDIRSGFDIDGLDDDNDDDDYDEDDEDDDDDDDNNDENGQARPRRGTRSNSIELATRDHHLASTFSTDNDKSNTLNTVYENNDEYEQDSDSFEDDDEEEDEDIEDALSGLSEEDDSDIEEELQFAARQIKRNAFEVGDDDSSSSRPPSTTTSPKAKRRKDPRRQKSLDVSPGQRNNIRNPVPVRPRAMSTRSGNSDLWSPVIPFKDSDSTGASLTDTTTNTTVTSQDKLELGLGLTNADRRDRSGSLLGPTFKSMPIKPVNQKSNLTSAIVAKQATFDNPLEQYIAASGRSERKPVRLKMYMPSCDQPREPWEALVRPDCTTHLAIGFALYCYKEQGRTPALTAEQCDANYWNLRIVEDDGEPDEDFPALDRTRQISAYSFDEFALVPATPEQKKENERKTPNLKKPASVSADAIAKPDAPAIAPANKSNEPSQEMAEVKVFKYPFNEMTSPLFWEATVSVDTYVGELLEQLCSEKLLDQSMYAFKIADTRMVIGNEMKLGTLQGQYTLELTPRRVMTKANGYVEPTLTSSLGSMGTNNTRSVYTTLALRGAEDAKRDRKSVLASSTVPEVLNTAGYRKYMVWRRQPMSFIGRHERILAIDGEYVHIMPGEDKTFFESPKTSSFHIGQVMKCKQSRKIPANFKIVVRKNSGPKRYDLEAISGAQASEIVAKVRSIALTYKHTT